jgi:hypothetical protein
MTARRVQYELPPVRAGEGVDDFAFVWELNSSNRIQRPFQLHPASEGAKGVATKMRLGRII